jgi:hypothetical protein
MSIEHWWPRVKPSTREWLIENNGEAVPAEIVADVRWAGGSITSDAWWVGENGPAGFFISDEAADWVEEIANEEDPETPSSSA